MKENNKPIHSDEISSIFRGMAWWAVGTGILGISHGKTIAGVGVLIGSAIAANYWRNPTFGWRRNIDIVWVQILLWPHLYYAWWSPVKVSYYSISALGALGYLFSWYSLTHGYIYGSVFGHMLCTACANLSLSLLYSFPISS
jgi:hypothetical protein